MTWSRRGRPQRDVLDVTIEVKALPNADRLKITANRLVMKRTLAMSATVELAIENSITSL